MFDYQMVFTITDEKVSYLLIYFAVGCGSGKAELLYLFAMNEDGIVGRVDSLRNTGYCYNKQKCSFHVPTS